MQEREKSPVDGRGLRKKLVKLGPERTESSFEDIVQMTFLAGLICGNVLLLGIDPDFINDDTLPPFNVPSLLEKLDMKALPPS